MAFGSSMWASLTLVKMLENLEAHQIDRVDFGLPPDKKIDKKIRDLEARKNLEALVALRKIRVKLAKKVEKIQRVATTPRRRQRGAQTRSSSASGDSNSDDPEPEPERPLRPLLLPYLYTETTLAPVLGISKKTLQNLYSKSPWLLPPAIRIPGARGPRWTPQAVQEWLSDRPRHTPKIAPVAPRRKAGRPRIALVKQGGAA